MSFNQDKNNNDDNDNNKGNDNNDDNKDNDADKQSNKRIQLYYSPRILPEDLEPEEDQKTDAHRKSEVDMKRFIHAIVREEVDKFHQLLPYVNLNGTSSQNNRWTPLLWAIQKDRLFFIKEMFKTSQVIDFSKQMDHKMHRTALHFAAERGDLELVQLLLQKDKEQQLSTKNPHIQLDINAKDREGSTALFRAAKIGAEDVIKVLLEFGADPNIVNRDDISPLVIAAHRGYLDVVDELLKYDQIDVNVQDSRGRTALMVACSEDRKAVVRRLLKCQLIKLNLNATDLQNYNWNCLMWCAYRKNEDILTTLLNFDRELDFNYFHESMFGKNSLEMAMEHKLSKKVVTKLRKQCHAVLFPKLVESQLIVQLRIPVVVLGVLLVFTY